MAERRLLPLGGRDLTEFKAALRSAGLSADDLREDRTDIYLLEDADGAIGWAALERCGDESLLRSVLVLDHRRRSGAGSDLVRRVVARAADQGVRRLWLLTETAVPFFERLGFRPTERSAAPAPIRETSEFRHVCPASAACMALSLHL